MPYNTLSTEHLNKIWLMYLRKSRQDDPNETVEEVLAKHEAILQEWAKRELGYAIPEDCIYREVISGESLEERTEVQKVLARMEDPNVVGILVVEPQRLSRGDLEDCGRLINDLRYTHTLVATPMMTYSMENKMERRFFQDELMRGRDYLEYTKEILLRGRIAATKRGCYIGRIPPYGYDKVVIAKDHTLEPNDNADVVRMIFDCYVNQNMTFFQIACKLNDLGIPSPTGIEWKKATIRHLLKNDHYDGKVHFNNIKHITMVENGERVTKRIRQPKDEVITAPGKHPALIDHETFQRAQDKLDLNPSVQPSNKLKNPFAGMLRCSKCGLAMIQHPYKHAEDRLECRKQPRCYKSAKMSEVTGAVIAALELSELPQLEAKQRNGEGKSIAIQQKILEKLQKQMEEYKAQEEKQYDLLETGKYSQDLFDKRNAALRQKMEACQEQIYETKRTMPKEVDYEERIIAMNKAIAALKDDNISIEEKNRLLKAIIERIDYTGSPSVEKNFVKGENDIKLAITLRLH